MTVFLSTPSARRATQQTTPKTRRKKFLSTPSARRATARPSKSPSSNRNFYPRPPRGGRRGPLLCVGKCERFLSTPSARRATEHTKSLFGVKKHFYPRPPRGGRRTTQAERLKNERISIHALREEGDWKTISTLYSTSPFLSTPSARRATAKTEKNISAFVSL